MTDSLVSILDGNTFVVSDHCGDIEATPSQPTGLFAADTRFLSRWVLTVNGERLASLSMTSWSILRSVSFWSRATGTVYVDATLSVIRQRSVRAGLPRGADDLQSRRVAGRSDRSGGDRGRLRGPVRSQGRAAEERGDVSSGRERPADARVQARSVVRGRRGSAPAPEARRRRRRAQLRHPVSPGHGGWTTYRGRDRASAGRRNVSRGPNTGTPPKTASPPWTTASSSGSANAPTLTSNWVTLERTYRRSVIDLAALRFFPARLRPQPSSPLACRGS